MSRLPLPVVALAVVAGLAASPLAAQDGVSPAARAAMASITEADVARRVGIIAHDSMGGRNTPSRGLDLTAAWIASEFRRFGLKPGGDSGSFLQRYPLSRRVLDGEASSLVVTVNGTPTTLSFRRDVYFSYGPRTGKPIIAPVVLLGGTISPEAITAANVAGKIVLVATSTANQQRTNRALAPLLQKNPAAVLTVAATDSALFARRLLSQFREQVGMENATPGGAPILDVHERALAPLLASARVDLAATRAAGELVLRELPGVGVTLTVGEQVSGRTFAPNVVGILEGSDPVLKKEYVVFSAHMDHVGTGAPVNGDSIFNGADDDASGTVGIVELAEAYTRSGARPKRSLIFLTVSGEEKGLWGSEWFAERPPVPMTQVVANLNMDMIGRNWKDTIVVIGKEHSDLGRTLNTVNAAHPELGMSAIDDQWPDQQFYFRSDHYNFARKGVPILFFFNGTHADYHRPSDSVDKIDAEKEARILKLVFLIGQSVGNAAERPKWNPESYQKIVQVAQ